MLQEPFRLSEDFQNTLDTLENSREPVFITGKAGTGKSTLLQLFRKTTRKKTVVLSPTGVAALNVGGQTIHSFFKFPPRLLTQQEMQPIKNRRLLQSLEVLVIDEISMVRADLLDHMDFVLRHSRRSGDPFGGVQMVFVGDLFQLPPVVSTHYEKEYFHTVYESPYFFSARVLGKDFRPQLVELTSVYRQEERHFINLLDAIRSGDVDEELLAELNVRVTNPREEILDHIVLTARNQVAFAINTRELNKLETTPRVYTARISGQFNPALFPTEAALRLKPGARVMLLKNDPARKFVNGTIGIIDTLEDQVVTVRIRRANREEQVEIAPHEWEILKYTTDRKTGEIRTETVGSFIQFPIRLAWAITIHKSQGKTFDKVLIDLKGGAFEHGQTYVALSRCRTLDGILLQHPVRYHDILIDERIIDFYQQQRRY